MSHRIFKLLFKVYVDVDGSSNVTEQTKKRFTFNNFVCLIWPVSVAREKVVHHDAVSDFLLQNVHLV